jgi:hypothetical protein
MIDAIGEVFRSVGRKGDAASSTGSVHAKLSQILTQLPVGLGIASFQMGTITITGGNGSGIATISSVDTTRTSVVYLGATVPNEANTNGLQTLALTNATTVTANRDFGGANSLTVAFLVVTWNSVASLQNGTVTIVDNGATLSATATITSVNTAKAILIWAGTRGQMTNANFLSRGFARVVLTNATTVTATRSADGNEGGSLKIAFTVVEFT